MRELPLLAELRAHPELAGRPLAVASGPGPRAELVAVSPEAARAGARRPGSVAHARAVCPELCVRVASPALESATRDALLDAALSLSPRAALAPRRSGAWSGEAAVHLDASGVASVFGSELGFATALAARAERLGLPGCTAVASSRHLAHVAARSLAHAGAGPCLVPAGGEASFLAPLPVDLLEPDDDVAEVLTRFGVHRVRDLLRLPRRGLATRLGPGVLRLLARARGEEREAPLPAPTRGRMAESVELESPVDRLEPLLFALQGPLSRLIERLEARHLACAELSLACELEGGGRDARRVGAAAPTRDPRVLMRLLRHALEARPPAAPVCGVALETEGRRVGGDQLDLFRPAGPAPAALGHTLAELASLCGEGRVGSPAVADDHHPDAFGLVPFHPGRGGRDGRDGCDAGPEAPLPVSAPRLALRALRPPVPARVRLRGGRPVSLRSAVANGRVLRLAGPWRTTGAWWSPEKRFAYDSFDVQTGDGTISRLRFDHVAGSWHVDGVYD